MTRFAPLARLPRPARWLVRFLIVSLVLALVLALYVRWTIQRSYPQTSGRLTVKGLSKDVTVYRDQWGVPQIYADDADDLMRAQGYVHAQDRFWEMDFRRHVTAGRLSELFGESPLGNATLLRALRGRGFADHEVAALEPTTKGYYDAYADGVNAYL